VNIKGTFHFKILQTWGHYFWFFSEHSGAIRNI